VPASAINAMDDPVEAWTPPLLRDQATDRLRAELRAAAAECAQLRAALAEAQQLADHDALTGLLNRRGFERELGRTLAACRRYGVEAALIYLDLDGFKSINDHFGHAAGDEALKAVAGALSRGVRESDVVARLGGDEFAVILNHAGRAAANGKARVLCQTIEAMTAGPGQPIRLSFGVRAFEAGMEPEQILAEADAAMFVRKGERRRA
jgi:diguanylate cyclase (GGDEF)-like protein